MERCTLSAPAKINLYLEIIGDRPDGYHELAMIMQSVALCDRLWLQVNGLEQFRLQCNTPGVPGDSQQLGPASRRVNGPDLPGNPS